MTDSCRRMGKMDQQPPKPAKRIGRPPTGKEQRSQLLATRAQPSSIRRWKAIAAKAGISFQQFVIEACEDLARRLGG